jgi:hypothetical protein
MSYNVTFAMEQIAEGIYPFGVVLMLTVLNE